MTRINIIPVEYITNRHLVAEYTEIRHISSSLSRSQKSKTFDVNKFPKKFTLNKGHVSFFYNKGKYIHKRFLSIQREMLKRGFNLSKDKMELNIEPFLSDGLYNDWTPDLTDMLVVASRIKQRIDEKPELYIDKDRFYDYYQFLNIPFLQEAA